ncbi:MAG TPA: segregation/condensation protein A [Firmicutes bacterium]|nr:segregation/condensation protein A [Bacillota bacterium]
MEKISYQLGVFEGPLDLLLTLLSKNKVSIYDVSISLLLEQYMEHIRAMQELDMDVASEFLDMAARLVYLKTVSLLPKHEEEKELRQQLAGELMEYQLCRQMAGELSKQFTFDRMTRKPLEIPMDHTYRRHHKPEEIRQAYLSAAGRGKRFQPPPAESFDGIVARPIVSVTSQIVFVLRRLWKKGKISYSRLFGEKHQRSERVAAFLAVLELIKGKRIRVEGEGQDAVITLQEGRFHGRRNK